MAKCDQCGADENMPYQCRYCGGTFCAEHRLPENHTCPGLDEWNDPQGVFDSGFDDSVRNPARDDDDLLAGIGLTGTGGPLSYFRGNMTFVFLALMWVTFLLQYVVAFVLPPFGNIGLTMNANPTWRAIFVFSTDNPLFVWTWFTSIFAHGGFFHIAVNSIVLYFFGSLVERQTGTKAFVALFLAAGVIAGAAQIASALVLGESSGVVGASGAIMAVMGVLTVLKPDLKVYLYFILPVPLWLLTIGFALYSVFVALSPGGGIGAGGVAHLAHLAGLVIGLGYGEKLRREGRQLPQQLQLGGGRGGMGPGRGRGPW